MASNMTLNLAFWVLGGTVLLGGALALPYLHSRLRRLPWQVRLLHGGLGAAGSAVLMLVLYRGLPPSTTGTTGFGQVAAVLFGLALVLGLATALFRVQAAGVLVAFHAGLAIAGFVVLWTLVSFI
jgi:hypothetical protein